MPNETDLALLLNQVPGLKEWLRTQVVSTLARRALTYLAMLLIGAGLLSPNGQEAFITDHLETAVGVILELCVVGLALLSVRKRGKLVQAAILADPTSSLAEVKAQARADIKPTTNPEKARVADRWRGESQTDYSILHDTVIPAEPSLDVGETQEEEGEHE